MKVKSIDTNIIKPYGKNAKAHPKKQIEQVAASIKEFGFNQPIVVDKDNVVIVGHGRLEAAKQLGLDEVPVLVADLTEEQAKAYRLADNKLNESDWDMDLVIEELKGLEPAMIDLTGFDQDLVIDKDIEEDDVPDVPEEPKAKLGEVYQLGEHRLMCGDATKIEDVEKLMDGEKADMVFTDPPYGMNYSGRGENTSEGILGDQTDPTKFYNPMPDISERYIWGRVENYKHLASEPRDTIIWKKNNFGMGRGYRGQYECCFYYGDFNGSDSDVWEIPKDSKYEHPTQKPVALCARAIKNSNPKSVVDLFGGSGSTLIACEQTNRMCYMSELDSKYVDVIINRWMTLTGKMAYLIEDAERGRLKEPVPVVDLGFTLPKTLQQKKGQGNKSIAE